VNTAAEVPTILVLAGINGAGKSSLGGGLLKAKNLPWFNPDDFARELKARSGCSQEEANAHAWAYGRAALENSIRTRTSWAFETTLGGNTIPALLLDARKTHRLMIWFCGLESVEKHIERVHARVRIGGHAIPEEKIRERWISSRANLVQLLPHVHALQVYDNSEDAGPDGQIPDPRLLLDYNEGAVRFPQADDPRALAATSEWARPIVQAALHAVMR
jgi:predicted ABC-type ATPase